MALNGGLLSVLFVSGLFFLFCFFLVSNTLIKAECERREVLCGKIAPYYGTNFVLSVPAFFSIRNCSFSIWRELE